MGSSPGGRLKSRPFHFLPRQRMLSSATCVRTTGSSRFTAGKSRWAPDPEPGGTEKEQPAPQQDKVSTGLPPAPRFEHSDTLTPAHQRRAHTPGSNAHQTNRSQNDRGSSIPPRSQGAQIQPSATGDAGSGFVSGVSLSLTPAQTHAPRSAKTGPVFAARAGDGESPTRAPRFRDEPAFPRRRTPAAISSVQRAFAGGPLQRGLS